MLLKSPTLQSKRRMPGTRNKRRSYHTCNDVSLIKGNNKDLWDSNERSDASKDQIIKEMDGSQDLRIYSPIYGRKQNLASVNIRPIGKTISISTGIDFNSEPNNLQFKERKNSQDA